MIATFSFYNCNKYTKLLSIYCGNNQWETLRNKEELLHKYCESADVEIKHEYYLNDISETSTAPSYYDHVSRRKKKHIY